MAIRSNAFGRTVLTDQDAKKFKSQATYGRPKEAAKESAKRGSKLLGQMKRHGSVTVKSK
jgi:hypothetical protein